MASHAPATPPSGHGDGAPVVLITGASGLLGRTVLSTFETASPGVRAVGTALTRGIDGVRVVKLDLRDSGSTATLVSSLKPVAVIHAAAERRPDVCESAPHESEEINVVATWNLARAAAAAGAAFILIGTDYVFDGSAPPYGEDSMPRPLNAYGVQKLRAEWAARAAHPHAIVLRVPVLYGPSTDWKESAVTSLVAPLLSSTPANPAPLSLDDWQIRVPTYTPDIAAVLVKLVDRCRACEDGAAPLSGVFHYSSADRLTRYTLVREMCGLLGVDGSKVVGVAAPPAGAPRPRDATLSCDRLKEAGAWVPPTPLKDGLAAVFAGLSRS